MNQTSQNKHAKKTSPNGDQRSNKSAPEEHNDKDTNHSNSVNCVGNKIQDTDGTERVDLLAQPPGEDLIDKMLPKELILKIFSFLDTISLCRCAQVSKYWNHLALDGSNWQFVTLFDFRIAVHGRVVENLSKRCGDFLKKLTLKGCKSVTDASMEVFCRNCRNLEEINLDDCKQLTDDTCKSLASHCHKLITLNLASCDITNESLTALGCGCRNLRHINLSNCNKIRPAGIEFLANNCTELVSFISTVCDNSAINDESLKALATNCHKLKILNLNGCKAITDTGVKYLSDNLHQLVYLILSKCFAITDQSLINLGQGCQQLRNLGLAGCHQLTDHGFHALTKNCKYLESLDLEDCVLITDQTLYYLTSNCLNLKRLALSHCDNITDDGIRYIGTSQKSSETIQYLELDNCTQLTDAAMEYLSSCKQLKRLDIFDNSRISRQATKKLFTYLPNLEIKTYFPTSTPQEQGVTEARRRYCRCCAIL